MFSNSAVKNTLAAKFAMKNDKKSEIFHTSAYAQAQAREAIGAAAGTESFQVRRDLEEKRKFVRGYKDSKLMQGTFAARQERAKTYSGETFGSRASSGGSSNRRSWRERQEQSAANPMDVAMQRAKNIASSPNGLGSSAVARKATPVLSGAKAPSIPSRRAGI